MSRVKSYYWEQLEAEAQQYQEQNEIEYLNWYNQQKQKEDENTISDKQ